MTPHARLGTSLGAAAALAAARLEELRKTELFREDLFVGGRWRPASGGRRLEVRDPATGALVGSVATASADDAVEAVAAAAGAFGAWRALPAGARSQVLWRWQDLLVSRIE